MEVYRRSSWLLLLLGATLLATSLQGVQGEVESEGPSESECRPYIEKALKELEAGEAIPPSDGDSREDIPTIEITTDDSEHPDGGGEDEDERVEKESTESAETEIPAESVESKEKDSEGKSEEKDERSNELLENADDFNISSESQKGSNEDQDKSVEHQELSAEERNNSIEDQDKSSEDHEESTEKEESNEEKDDTTSKTENDEASIEAIPGTDEESGENAEDDTDSTDDIDDSKQYEGGSNENDTESAEKVEENDESKEDTAQETEDSKEESRKREDEHERQESEMVGDSRETDSKETTGDSKEDDIGEKDSKENEETNTKEDAGDSKEVDRVVDIQDDTKEDTSSSAEDSKVDKKDDAKGESEPDHDNDSDEGSQEDNQKENKQLYEELAQEFDDSIELRPREHIEQLLKLDEDSSESENIINRAADITLKELKKVYENAIKPLEALYKYRDLSNRHFGDAEIFSKPLVLFMGPWSGGKSTLINYLLENEYEESALRTGAEPSPAYFNIVMHGDEPEIIDGTQLAADYTFSGLQKFGQGLEERLRGYRMPKKLLEKMNIVEIPGILEVRKQVSRVFPFNDACQWFIDRADIIFLVYDPSKLDVGPETEAILDQLKGREYQTRIILNKADQVKPEELMRVQGALIWNISPLMSSAQPPVMYTTSLWSKPFEPWAPVRLLQAQERAFLRDLRSAIDKRIENKISSARRFAVRVRNHAKMVDCYLTTYYNHKSVFGNRKQVSDEIIEHPQDYHIYEGLSTLTNISRYDLPDPDVYRDFFRLNPLYEFQQLSATCTYFRGCPINRLDIAIAYDLPELVGKHRRLVEAALAEASAPAPAS